MRCEHERRFNHFWREHRSTVLFLALLFCFRSSWADWVHVPTGSMNPTILEGDRIFVNKHIFGVRLPFSLLHLTQGENPARGDIVVFDSPLNQVSLVKRVVAVPGDTLLMQGEELFVNGRHATHSPGDPQALRTLLSATRAHDPRVWREAGMGIAHNILLLPDRPQSGDIGPVNVPPDMYFMLGDNRDNSADSRFIGFVPRRNIVGRATHVVVSLNPENFYIPRSGRVLTSLY